jgi:hypothetical protein
MFNCISARRPYGMNGPQPIGMLDIKAYVDLRGIKREDDLDLMMEVLPQLDDIWLSDYYQQAEKKRSQKKK